MFSCSQNSFVLLLPRSDLFNTTPNGTFIFRTTSTANFKSCKPKGVGSVTKITKSELEIVSTTGQDVPGGASNITVSFLFMCFFLFIISIK
mgnify:CR=1 FL=1